MGLSPRSILPQPDAEPSHPPAQVNTGCGTVLVFSATLGRPVISIVGLTNTFEAANFLLMGRLNTKSPTGAHPLSPGVRTPGQNYTLTVGSPTP